MMPRHLKYAMHLTCGAACTWCRRWEEQKQKGIHESARDRRQVEDDVDGGEQKAIEDRFRSCDLWVMGPPRFHCATSINKLHHSGFEPLTFRV